MVIAYLNIGSDRAQEDVQRKVIDTFLAAKKNVQVDKWVLDVSRSKSKKIGKNLEVVLERVKEGDTLIVSDVTRLSSSLLEMLNVLSLCLTKKVRIWCVEDRYIFDSSMDAEKMIEVFRLVDMINHSLVTMRTKDTLAELQKAGKKLGRPVGVYASQHLLYENKDKIMNMLERGESLKSVCKHFGVAKNTFYEFKKNFKLE